MESIYDWLTVGIFAGLIVLFLQRSSQDEEPRDSIWQYLGASVGCAVVNYLGNEGYHLVAMALLAAVIAYIVVVLRPFAFPKLD